MGLCAEGGLAVVIFREDRWSKDPVRSSVGRRAGVPMVALIS
jgi:hypothetical protein